MELLFSHSGKKGNGNRYLATTCGLAVCNCRGFELLGVSNLANSRQNLDAAIWNCGGTFVLGFWRILSALKRISLVVQLLGSLPATATVGDSLKGLRSRFEVLEIFSFFSR